MNEDRIIGCILGTAVGDSIGLPYEGLSRSRASKLLGPPDRQRFFFGRGMVSDDTEHLCITAQALITAGGDLDAFQQSLARGLRFWLLGLPAGIGLATLRSTLRLWMGIPPQQSGVFSAGNGPAMRAAILGAALPDPQSLGKFTAASSRITHTDPKSQYGAFAVALAAQLSVQNEEVAPDFYLDQLRQYLEDEASELLALISDAVISVKNGQSTEAFAEAIGLGSGVSGYIYHSVPVAMHAWLSHPRDCRSAIISVVRCGGDTDSTAAIVGGLIGVSAGRAGIPQDWLNSLYEWPRTVSWMERLGTQLATQLQSNAAVKPIRLPAAGLFARNLFFLLIVLWHGLRRIAPPY